MGRNNDRVTGPDEAGLSSRIRPPRAGEKAEEIQGAVVKPLTTEDLTRLRHEVVELTPPPKRPVA